MGASIQEELASCFQKLSNWTNWSVTPTSKMNDGAEAIAWHGCFVLTQAEAPLRYNDVQSDTQIGHGRHLLQFSVGEPSRPNIRFSPTRSRHSGHYEPRVRTWWKAERQQAKSRRSFIRSYLELALVTRSKIPARTSDFQVS